MSLGGDGFLVVIFQALVAGDVADGVERRAADFAGALGDIVGHGEDLLGLLVEEQMVIAEMASADVPVKVFGLHIERKDVRQQVTQDAGNLRDGIAAQVRRDCPRLFSVVSPMGIHLV